MCEICDSLSVISISFSGVTFTFSVADTGTITCSLVVSYPAFLYSETFFGGSFTGCTLPLTTSSNCATAVLSFSVLPSIFRTQNGCAFLASTFFMIPFSLRIATDLRKRFKSNCFFRAVKYSPSRVSGGVTAPPEIFGSPKCGKLGYLPRSNCSILFYSRASQHYEHCFY